MRYSLIFHITYIPSCKYMMFRVVNCIHCGKQPKGPFIELRENNVIDPNCLAEIEQLVENHQDLD
jgi:hypothetical protein